MHPNRLSPRQVQHDLSSLNESLKYKHGESFLLKLSVVIQKKLNSDDHLIKLTFKLLNKLRSENKMGHK